MSVIHSHNLAVLNDCALIDNGILHGNERDIYVSVILHLGTVADGSR